MLCSDTEISKFLQMSVQNVKQTYRSNPKKKDMYDALDIATYLNLKNVPKEQLVIYIEMIERIKSVK